MARNNIPYVPLCAKKENKEKATKERAKLRKGWGSANIPRRLISVPQMSTRFFPISCSGGAAAGRRSPALSFPLPFSPIFSFVAIFRGITGRTVAIIMPISMPPSSTSVPSSPFTLAFWAFCVFLCFVFEEIARARFCYPQFVFALLPFVSWEPCLLLRDDHRPNENETLAEDEVDCRQRFVYGVRIDRFVLNLPFCVGFGEGIRCKQLVLLFGDDWNRLCEMFFCSEVLFLLGGVDWM